MFTILTTNHLLTLFLVVGLGAVLGVIKFGPVRLGAAGALFVGLMVSVAVPGAGSELMIVQQIGLAFFVYTVGIAAGSTFFADLRKQTMLLTSCALICLLGAIVSIVCGSLLGLNRGLVTGLFSGALTAAPALDAATRVTGDPQAAVGYAFGYPIGVIVGIVVVTFTVTRRWMAKKDTPSVASASLDSITIRVRADINTRHIDAWAQQRIKISYLRRGERTRVLVPGEDLLKDDLVLMVGDPDSLNEAFKQVGDPVVVNLAQDRTEVVFERVVISNPDISGHTVSELNMTSRFGALITRVRRGDLELLAKDDLALQLGDRVAVAAPIADFDQVQDFLGDSERRVSEVDAMGFGIGMVLGLALGAIPFPMPGGATFELGSAAGPLIVGMLLGGLRRTGPFIWTLPDAVNITIRQVGLLLFLAALGLNAGPNLWIMLSSDQGWRAGILCLATVGICCVAFALIAGHYGLSAQRSAGGVAGFLGQPAVLQAATARVADERIEAAYATLFAFSIVIKILLIPLIWTV